MPFICLNIQIYLYGQLDYIGSAWGSHEDFGIDIGVAVAAIGLESSLKLYLKPFTP
jgi:hypothetical protein